MSLQLSFILSKIFLSPIAVRGRVNINLICIYVDSITTAAKIKLPELDLESSSVINLGI